MGYPELNCLLFQLTEITVRGTGLKETPGKEDPVEFGSIRFEEGSAGCSIGRRAIDLEILPPAASFF